MPNKVISIKSEKEVFFILTPHARVGHSRRMKITGRTSHCEERSDEAIPHFAYNASYKPDRVIASLRSQ
jgi:hypothetical protein